MALLTSFRHLASDASHLKVESTWYAGARAHFKTSAKETSMTGSAVESGGESSETAMASLAALEASEESPGKPRGCHLADDRQFCVLSVCSAFQGFSQTRNGSTAVPQKSRRFSDAAFPEANPSISSFYALHLARTGLSWNGKLAMDS